MAQAKDKPDAEFGETATETKAGASHIRFVGHPSEDENSACTVFGKTFYRGKWVPLTNLDGTNPEKKALTEFQLGKLTANPAFELGNGEDAPVPGVSDEVEPSEEA